MKYKAFFFLAIFILSACGNDLDKVADSDSEDTDKSVEGFQEALIDFSKTKFDDPTHLSILKELNVCLMIDQDSTLFATCSPENFLIIPFKDGSKVKDAFILVMKAGIVLKGQRGPLPERNIIVFEREAGELVKVNGFRGDLTAIRDGSNGVKDLIVTFYSKEEKTFFDCIFKWDGKRYDFKFVERLNWGEGFKPVKASMMDSISKEIYTELMQKAKIF